MLRAFREHESPIRGYLSRFVDDGHDIEDICQETMLRALEAAERRTIRQPGAFLFGIARNIVRRRFERRSHSLVDLVAQFTPDDHAADPRPLDDIMAERERLDRYDQAIAGLPPQCRRVFVLAKVYGYTHREISSMLGISVRTVENHVANGFKRCSDELAASDRNVTSQTPIIRFPKRR